MNSSGQISMMMLSIKAVADEVSDDEFGGDEQRYRDPNRARQAIMKPSTIIAMSAVELMMLSPK
jgi:hypothetical protein